MMPGLGWAAIAIAIVLPPAALRAHGAGSAGWGGPRSRGTLAHPAAFAFLGVGIYILTGQSSGWIPALGIVCGAVWIGVYWISGERRRTSIPTPVSSGHAPAGSRVDPDGNGLTSEAEGLLHRFVAMKGLRVDSILTPRDRIVAADCADGVDGAMARIRASGHMRIPMTDGSLDRITGVIHAKDLLSLLRSPRHPPALKGLMRRPLFVSMDTSASDLLELFRSARAHLAIVVDPFGRTVGLVTRRDLFRHLMGEEGGAG